MPGEQPVQGRKLLVIGGGTGVNTAEIMGHDKRTHVTLLEKEDYLGGHIKSKRFTEAEVKAAGGTTRQGDKSVVELGAEFFGPEEAYPLAHARFRYLFGEEGYKKFLRPFTMSAHINPKDKSVSDNSIVLPPVFPKYGEGNCITKCFVSCCGGNTEVQDDIGVSWDSLLSSDMAILAYFQLALCDYAKDLRDNPPANPDDEMTLEQFVTHFEKEYWYLPGVERLRKEFIDNLCTAQWGISFADAREFMAKYAINYLYLGMTWYDAPGGLDEYMQKQIDILKQREREGRADIRTNTAVDKVLPFGKQYKVRLKDGSMLQQDGQDAVFDHVVAATHPHVTAEILSEVPQKAASNRECAQVGKFPTRMIFHCDHRLASAEGTVVNTILENGEATNHALKLWKHDIVKSWGNDKQTPPDPKKVLHEQHWEHDLMKRSFSRAERAMVEENRAEAAQSDHGAVLNGGAAAGGGDSHNDALEASAQNCLDLCRLMGLDPAKNPSLLPLIERNARTNEWQVKRKNTQLPNLLEEARRDLENEVQPEVIAVRERRAVAPAHSARNLGFGRVAAVASSPSDLMPAATIPVANAQANPLDSNATKKLRLPMPAEDWEVKQCRANVAHRLKSVAQVRAGMRQHTVGERRGSKALRA